MTKPLLLIDVDGPLNPTMSLSQARAAGYQRYQMNPLTESGQSWRDVHGMRLRVFLNRAHGTALLELAELYDLVWATTWRDDANAWIAPRLGLPRLPFIELTDRPFNSETRKDGTYWKTHEIVQYVDGRPFVWIDDQVSSYDPMYAMAHHPGPFLIHKVDHAVGLTTTDFEALATWATEEAS